MGELYVALIHAPVYNKNMEQIATSITNLDLHDIARSSATYGVNTYYVVHPGPAQQDLARRIMGFWREGYGAEYNPNRYEAFEKVKLASTLEEVVQEIKSRNPGKKLFTVATDARLYRNTIEYSDLRRKLEETDEDFLLLFGTGWGIIKEEMEKADYILKPVYGFGDYNHLSVRSAAAIILDRLRGH
ncbi:MAG: RNA methyltransferase [Dehalobacter sp. 4CP]|uniref:RNA methyltransferase n=1 Tax=Dehalobacter sp. CP TaxID=2594474 RepID=UPI0013C72C78|nr:RNA methyltransferase [Dehalobacter sp.]NBJ15641.1 RNA methyltransferase [Dehalobacter sp. 4CP]